MLVLRTSNFQGATIRPIVPRLNFLPRASSKINQTSIELSSTFSDESRESQMKNLNRQTDKTPFVQLQLFFFSTNALVYTEMNFHGRLLSIRIFSADGQAMG